MGLNPTQGRIKFFDIDGLKVTDIKSHIELHIFLFW